MPEETRKLLVSALGGGEEARGALLERLRPRLVLWAATRMSPALRAKLEPEDVAQEVLLAAHKDLPRFQGDDDRAFLAWLFTIAENRIRDIANNLGALKRRTPTARARTQTSPSGAAARKEMAVLVREALSTLGEDHRRIIQLRRFEEMAVPEIAQRLGKSPNAVRILYCRAIKALREAMTASP